MRSKVDLPFPLAPIKPPAYFCTGMFYNFYFPKLLGGFFYSTKNTPRRNTYRKINPHIGPFQFSIFNAINFIQPLHNTLCCCGFGGFCFKTLHKFFLLAYVILLVFISTFLQFYPLHFFF